LFPQGCSYLFSQPAIADVISAKMLFINLLGSQYCLSYPFPEVKHM
jgi:hypothetical protein